VTQHTSSASGLHLAYGRHARLVCAPATLVTVCALLTACALPGSVFAGPDRFAPGKVDRPDGPRELYRGQPIPCDQPRQTVILQPGTLTVYADETSGTSLIDAYGCQPGWAMTGPEHLYILNPEEDLILVALLAGNDPVDHDLILLAACHTDSCLVQANTELSGTLRAGRSYYLMVDGYQGAAGPYSLTLETHHLGLSPVICEPGGAIPVDLGGAGPFEFAGNLHDAPNLISLHDCSPVTVAGGEVWYALALPAAAPPADEAGFGSHVRVSITATTGAETLDLALWLFDGCGPDAVCLAFADQGNAGQSETLVWQNLAPEPVTVYLAVDCLRAPAAEVFGSFNLAINPTVGAERRSLTGVRSLFR
jgi:hypothetical protein